MDTIEVLARRWVVRFPAIPPVERKYQWGVSLQRVMEENRAAVGAEPLPEIDPEQPPPVRRNAVPLTTADRLTDMCRDGGLFVTGDGRVTEPDAAGLLGYSAGHLKHLRHEGAGPAFHRVGINGHRISYTLGDLAAWLDGRREDW